jgi:hypothetical protein
VLIAGLGALLSLVILITLSCQNQLYSISPFTFSPFKALRFGAIAKQHGSFRYPKKLFGLFVFQLGTKFSLEASAAVSCQEDP